MSKKALFAGSFDPLTSGHLDLIKRSAGLCEHLVVGVVANPGKNPLFSLEERKAMIEEVTKDIPNVSVDSFSGLLADYVNANGFDMVVRGLRAASDFESEQMMAQMNSRLYRDGVETVFLMTSPEFSYISSSMMKEVASLGGGIDGLVPDHILKCIKDKFGL